MTNENGHEWNNSTDNFNTAIELNWYSRQMHNTLINFEPSTLGILCKLFVMILVCTWIPNKQIGRFQMFHCVLFISSFFCCLVLFRFVLSNPIFHQQSSNVFTSSPFYRLVCCFFSGGENSYLHFSTILHNSFIWDRKSKSIPGCFFFDNFSLT